jgi:outer membrane protein assembly factor BamB
LAARSPGLAGFDRPGHDAECPARLGAGGCPGRVYTIDTTATVRAFDARPERRSGTQFGTERGNEPSLFGGGIAYGDGRIYATNGLGFVAALDATNGGIAWQVRPGGPLRGRRPLPPTRFT